jgi:hypothetical protein
MNNYGVQGDVKRKAWPLHPKYQPHLPAVDPVTTKETLVTEYRRYNLNTRYGGNAILNLLTASL